MYHNEPELESEIEWYEEDQLFVCKKHGRVSICYLFNIICFLQWV